MRRRRDPVLGCLLAGRARHLHTCRGDPGVMHSLQVKYIRHNSREILRRETLDGLRVNLRILQVTATIRGWQWVMDLLVQVSYVRLLRVQQTVGLTSPQGHKGEEGQVSSSSVFVCFTFFLHFNSRLLPLPCRKKI